MLNRTLTLTLIVLGIATLATPSTANAQTTWHVDDNAPNDPGPGDPTVSDPLEDGSPDHPFDAIQEGIDAAVSADTVLVLDGTYTGDENKDLDFEGKAITVRSENGYESCTIDCEGNGRGFDFHSGEGPDTIVDGLTITNGYLVLFFLAGGGVCFDECSPTLVNCTIIGNTSNGHGGGVYCYASNPMLINCTISGNSATVDGGGVCCEDSNPTLTNCTISGNSADYDGGGVYCDYSSPTLTNCTISGNWLTYDDGGGVYCSYSSPTLTNCTINGNSADSGGGVRCEFNSNPTLNNCTVSGNYVFRGGGVFCSSSSPTLVNCTISGNYAFGDGGGVYCYNSGNPTLTNCTISGNSTYVYSGGGVFCSSSSPTLANCILWGDAQQEIYVSSGSPMVTYCDVQGGWSGAGNINADPLFVDPDGPDDDPNTWEDNDYRLGPRSPCIDAGDNASVPADMLDLDGDGDTTEPWPIDLDGNPRFTDDLGMPDTGAGTPPIVDMGVYEFQGQSTGDTLHVPSEYPTIQAAIDAAVNGDVVEVADGTYAGEGNKNLDFGGKAITVRGASGDPALCIIDCEDSGRGFDFHSGEGPDSIVEALTITNGLVSYEGGGIYCAESSPTFVDCTVRENTVSSSYGRGGGVYCTENADAVFNDCVFTENSVPEGNPGSGGGGGGAIYSDGADLTLTNCTFTANWARLSGGAMVLGGGSPMLTGCTFVGNWAIGAPEFAGCGAVDSESMAVFLNCGFRENSGNIGGAVGVFYYEVFINCTFLDNAATWPSWLNGGGAMFTGGVPTIVNCAFHGNVTEGGPGGAIYNYWGQPLILNSSFAGNSSSESGGGVYCRPNNSVIIANCILWDNTPDAVAGDVSITYSNVQGGWAGDGNIDSDPLFVDPVNGDYHLATGSPCIDAADNTAVPADIADLDGDGDIDERTPFDFDGNPRFVEDPFSDDTGVADPPYYRHIVDMGAYEYQFCFGDLDDDNDIDLADLAQLLGSYGETGGMTYYDGDLDGDGDVDIIDLAELLGVYGTTCP